MSKRCKWGHDTPQPTCPDCMQPDTSVHYATGTGKSFAQQNQELRALLKEARCSHPMCHDGTLYTIKLRTDERIDYGECSFCTKRSALLGEGNDG